jgi:hypothetical protein
MARARGALVWGMISRPAHALAQLALLALLAFGAAPSLGCASKPGPGAAVGVGPAASGATPGVTAGTGAAGASEPHGAPLDFTLDPVERGDDHTPESVALRGKRAVVVVITTFDFGSQKLLREIGPTLRALPADATCLLVAMQPVGDRVLVQAFLDSEPTPCRRAIGDPARGRLGDLAKINVVPSVLVLRADGSLVGAAVGDVTPEALQAELEKAKK